MLRIGEVSGTCMAILEVCFLEEEEVGIKDRKPLSEAPRRIWE
jgi:hypothetical protein